MTNNTKSTYKIQDGNSLRTDGFAAADVNSEAPVISLPRASNVSAVR